MPWSAAASATPTLTTRQALPQGRDRCRHHQNRLSAGRSASRDHLYLRCQRGQQLCFKGAGPSLPPCGRHIISTPLEHSSVSGTLTALQEQGYEIDLLDVKQDGTVDLEHLKDLLRPDTICVAITLVDSELGVVQPVQEIAAILKAYPHCHLHVDATQAVGKIPVSFEGVDTMSLTAHKFYGLNGIGLVVKRRNLALEPLIHGGESTTIYRSGTPTVALASSLARALDLAIIDLPTALTMWPS